MLSPMSPAAWVFPLSALVFSATASPFERRQAPIQYTNITCSDPDVSQKCTIYSNGGSVACALINDAPTIVGYDGTTSAGVPAQCLAPACSCSLPPARLVNSATLSCVGQTSVTGPTTSITDYCRDTVGAYCTVSQPSQLVVPSGADSSGLCAALNPGAGPQGRQCTCLLGV